MGSLMILNGKFKYSILFIVVGGIGVGIAQIVMEENIITNSFGSALEDVSENSGTWGSRTEYARMQIEQFLEHPVIGSGKSTLSGSTDFRAGNKVGRVGKLLEHSANTHTGYTSWLLSYGLVGVVWLVCFIFLLFILGLRGLRNATAEERALITFGLSYIGFIIITNISLNHLQFPNGILCTCLASAIIVRILYNQEQREHRSGDILNVTEI